MTPPDAIARFVDQQKRLLRKTYDDGWLRGVDAYEPDEDPQQSLTLPQMLAVTGLTGAALALARRRYAYQAPGHPDPVRRAVALALAFQSINRMGLELGNLTTGSAAELMAAGGDPQEAVLQWAQANAWRLDAGDSVAWAGEQAGYAEAADADGQLLYSWTSVGDTQVCSDCELLSSFPPMALGEWPTSPGAGDTACFYGCRCTWDTWADDFPANYTPRLSDSQQALVDTLSTQQAQALLDMMPDVAYLE